MLSHGLGERVQPRLRGREIERTKRLVIGERSCQAKFRAPRGKSRRRIHADAPHEKDRIVIARETKGAHH